MRVHILGISGTFMGGIAVLAKTLGHEVSGSDENIYPPMSTQLENQGIHLFSGYSANNLPAHVDCIIVGNTIKRGNPEFEAVLNADLRYTSGPQWLAENVLAGRWVLAVSGTHGKTTTSSLLAWILDFTGKKPGFLIGGVPENFGVSARLGDSAYFVIEADEYDSALFDKRSKFVHYHPTTLILNNLEFDHADIFNHLDEIKKQFHHLIRTVPSKGLIINNACDPHLSDVLKMGCWTPVESFLADEDWQLKLLSADSSHFSVSYKNQDYGDVHSPLLGQHNAHNALAAIAAAHHIGVDPKQAMHALAQFKNVKRRLEIKSRANDITVYDDFAHHPTAVQTTLEGLRHHLGNQRILAVLEFGSYTMRSGSHEPHSFVPALKAADQLFLKASADQPAYANAVAACLSQPTQVFADTALLVQALKATAKPGDVILIMSNTGFSSQVMQQYEAS